MTRDDIIRMAEDAGIKIEIDWAGRPSTIVIKDGAIYLRGVHELERFAALVAAAEREACAKVCEDEAAEFRSQKEGCRDARYDWKEDAAMECSIAIRSRGEVKP